MFTCGPGLFSTASGGGGGSDPFFANVSSLLHFDGTNGSTTFTDQKGLVWSVGGGTPALSTTQVKFGTASLGVPGTGSPYISTPLDPSNVLLNNPFTIEHWVYIPSGLTGDIGLVFYVSGGGFQLLCGSTNFLRVDSRSISTVCTSSVAFPRDQWVFIAVTRNGSNVVTIWQNGVAVATATYAPAFPNAEIDIGRIPSALGCYFDDFRLTPGVCRYTTTFTPPTAAFPNS